MLVMAFYLSYETFRTMKLLIEEKLFIHILDMYVRNNKNFKEI